MAGWALEVKTTLTTGKEQTPLREVCPSVVNYHPTDNILSIIELIHLGVPQGAAFEKQNAAETEQC
jgi:hypothetical protein